MAHAKPESCIAEAPIGLSHGRVSQRPRGQDDLSWGEETLRRCLHRRSTPTSCANARSGSCSHRTAPIAAVARDSVSTEKRCASGSEQAEAEAGARSDLLTTSERERLKTLERENRELRKANETLKAASGICRQGARPSRPR